MVSGKNGYGIYILNQVTFRWDTYEGLDVGGLEFCNQ